MTVEIRVPAAGESVTEADIAFWSKSNGDMVQRDEVLCELETDKASLELTAEESGVLTICIQEGTVKVGDVLGFITPGDVSAAISDSESSQSATIPQIKESVVPEALPQSSSEHYAKGCPSPAASKYMSEKGLTPDQITGTGPRGRITKSDVCSFDVSAVVSSDNVSRSVSTETPVSEPERPTQEGVSEEGVRREPMSVFRKKLMARKVLHKRQIALLTTYNEVNMETVLDLVSSYNDVFEKRFQVSLSYWPFLIKAICSALKAFPSLNAIIEGNEVVYRDSVDIAFPVRTKIGTLYPVLRDCSRTSFDELQSHISGIKERALADQLALSDVSGGTFSILDNGSFGGMISSGLVLPGQSATLGLHHITDRPVVLDDVICVKPMMYVAVNYDHRLIDGAESVRFLVMLKDLLEDPNRMLIGV